MKTIQKHICINHGKKRSCVKSIKLPGKRTEKFCRAGFGKWGRPAHKEVKALDPLINGRILIDPPREENDYFIYPYIPWILESWKGNMDIQVIGISAAAISYIGKYISKKEQIDAKHQFSDEFLNSHLGNSQEYMKDISRFIEINANRKIYLKILKS